jgi:RNA polymerase sigma-70 factor (ECF subfamily)
MMARSRAISLNRNNLTAKRSPANDNAGDDRQLMERICAGEHVAFAALVHRHAQRFYRIAYRYTGNQGEAEDRVQDAFLKLWEKPFMWQAEKNTAFTTWFHRVVINLCLDQKKKKRPALLIDDTWIPDERDSQEQTLMQQQEQHWIESSINALPERQRTALNLCFYEELSNQEAADIMGVHLKALQSLLMRAKATLKEKMLQRAGA